MIDDDYDLGEGRDDILMASSFPGNLEKWYTPEC